jgi:hypothetical protein
VRLPACSAPGECAAALPLQGSTPPPPAINRKKKLHFPEGKLHFPEGKLHFPEGKLHFPLM